MLQVNEYFNGKVKSIALMNEEGKATVGVMAPGEYEFGTSTTEHMTVVSGSLTVLLPGESEWKTFSAYDTFIVPKDCRFKLKVSVDSAYKCLYK